MYDDIFDAKLAMDSLSGFNVDGRYLVLLYYNSKNINRKEDLKLKGEENERLRKLYGVQAEGRERD